MSTSWESGSVTSLDRLPKSEWYVNFCVSANVNNLLNGRVSQMGYAKPGQDTAGIHFRLYSRAFVIADQNGKRVCIVNCDVAMVSQIIKLEVSKHTSRIYKRLFVVPPASLSLSSSS
jgi:hypothetical protein